MAECVWVQKPLKKKNSSKAYYLFFMDGGKGNFQRTRKVCGVTELFAISGSRPLIIWISLSSPDISYFWLENEHKKKVGWKRSVCFHLQSKLFFSDKVSIEKSRFLVKFLLNSPSLLPYMRSLMMVEWWGADVPRCSHACVNFWLSLLVIARVPTCTLITMYAHLNHCRLRAHLIICSFSLPSWMCTPAAWPGHTSNAVSRLAHRTCLIHSELLLLGVSVLVTHLLMLWMVPHGYFTKTAYALRLTFASVNNHSWLL